MLPTSRDWLSVQLYTLEYFYSILRAGCVRASESRRAGAARGPRPCMHACRPALLEPVPRYP
jgi:hypothetical protein